MSYDSRNPRGCWKGTHPDSSAQDSGSNAAPLGREEAPRHVTRSSRSGPRPRSVPGTQARLPWPCCAPVRVHLGAQVPSGFTCHWRSGMSERERDCQFSVGATRGLPAHRDGIQIRFNPELRGHWAPGDGCPRPCGPSSRGHGERARHPCALMWQPPQVASRCRPCAGTRWKQD